MKKLLAEKSQSLLWAIGVSGFFVFLYLVKSILLPFVVGMLAAYFLDPAVKRLLRCKWSRAKSAGLITILFFVIVGILLTTLSPIIVHQLSDMIKEIPAYFAKLEKEYGSTIRHYIASLTPEQEDAIKETAGNFSGSAAHFLANAASEFFASGLALLNIVSLIFITPIVVFYLLRDWDIVVETFDKLLPREYHQTIKEQLHIIDQTLSGFIRGQTNVCLILASYYGIILSIIGLNFGAGLGILTGFLLFIPFVGFATCFTLSMVIGFFQFGLSAHLLAIAITYLVGMIMESSLITPRLVGSKVGLHPLWIIFGMLSGGALFGLVGVLISVPVTAVIGVLVRFAIANYLKA